MKNHHSCVKIKQPEKRDFFRGKILATKQPRQTDENKKREDEQTVRYAIIRLDLGVTRLGVGWTLFNTENKAFEETKPRDVKKLLLKKGVKGLTVDSLGDLTVDTDFTEDLAAKSGVGNYRLCLGGFNPKETRQVFIVVSKQISEFGDLYEVISQYYQHLIVDEDELINWLEHGDIVGGVDYNPLHRTIDLKPGVPVIQLNRPETNDIIGLAGCLEEIKPDSDEKQGEPEAEPDEKSDEQASEEPAEEHVEPAEEQAEPVEEQAEPVEKSEESEGSDIEKVEDDSDNIQHSNDEKSESEDPSLLSESKMDEAENNSEEQPESLTGMEPVSAEDLLNMLNNSENHEDNSSNSNKIPEVSMEDLISNPQEPDLSNLKPDDKASDSAEPVDKPKPVKRSHHKKR